MRMRYLNISHVPLVIESGDYFVQHVQKCGNNSRAATNRAWHLIEWIQYIILQAQFSLYQECNMYYLDHHWYVFMGNTRGQYT